MTLSDAIGYLTGAKRREAEAAVNDAYNGLMKKLDMIEGEERARKALNSLGARMRGRSNGLVADH